jgi:apolipoprotein N-acyltransferase
LPILRVAQDGRSYLVAANGAIVDELPEHLPGVLRLTSLPARRWTLYGQLGNWLAWLSLVILVLRLRRRPSGHGPTPASA